MSITPLTAIPDSAFPDTFPTQAELFLQELAVLRTQLNALTFPVFSALPAAPSILSPATLSSDAAIFFAALQTMISQINAQYPGEMTPLPEMPVDPADFADGTGIADDFLAALNLMISEISEIWSAVDAADFDGSADYMLRGADLTGLADGKGGLLSAWFRLDGGDSSIMSILANSTGGNYFRLIRAANNTIQIVGEDSSGTEILRMETSGTYLSGASWIHVLALWSLDMLSQVSQLYVNDVSDLNPATLIVTTGSTIDYTRGNFSVGSYTDGNGKFNGCLAEMYLASYAPSGPTQFISLADSTFRRKFRSAAGKPVFIGSDGSIPTGAVPPLYLHLIDGEAVSNFATNHGSGGAFSITGTLATASSSPSD